MKEINNIKYYISNGDTREAIAAFHELLFSLKSELINPLMVISADFENWKKEEIKGFQPNVARLNKINSRILDLLELFTTLNQNTQSTGNSNSVLMKYSREAVLFSLAPAILLTLFLAWKFFFLGLLLFITLSFLSYVEFLQRSKNLTFLTTAKRNHLIVVTLVALSLALTSCYSGFDEASTVSRTILDVDMHKDEANRPNINLGGRFITLILAILTIVLHIVCLKKINDEKI